MKMIGISLPYKWLCGEEPQMLPENLLSQLYEHGVRSIEMRAVPVGGNSADVLRIANRLWDYGFNITVHASAHTAENAVEEVLAPLTAMLTSLRQKELIVTVHPINGNNTAMLISLSDFIASHAYPVRIALENERRLPDKTEGDSLALVLDAVTLANRENVGICFDMGHYAWYCKNRTDNEHQLPPEEFMSRVIHTHIHRCIGETTHFPLDGLCEPYASYVNALDYGYFGVYNIEISPHVYADIYSAEEGYLLSARTMLKNLPFHAALYEDIRLNYDNQFRQALEIFKKTDGCYASLIGPSSYIFNTNGFHWAMDVSFGNMRFLAESPSHIREHLGKLNLIILTHEHADHMETSTIRTLADTDITWVAPDFLVDKLLLCGIEHKRIIPVKAGETVTTGPLNIRVLPGRHYRPDTGKGCDAVGYMITADNAPSIAFPSDVRDYRTDNLCPLDADWCFAHVWLSDFACDTEKNIKKSAEFADFMLKMSSRNIVLAHLYESSRTTDSIWQIYHADIARKAILERSPQAVVRTPKYGEILCLG